jgi:hypothetical protein
MQEDHSTRIHSWHYNVRLNQSTWIIELRRFITDGDGLINLERGVSHQGTARFNLHSAIAKRDDEGSCMSMKESFGDKDLAKLPIPKSICGIRSEASEGIEPACSWWP